MQAQQIKQILFFLRTLWSKKSYFKESVFVRIMSGRRQCASVCYPWRPCGHTKKQKEFHLHPAQHQQRRYRRRKQMSESGRLHTKRPAWWTGAHRKSLAATKTQQWRGRSCCLIKYSYVLGRWIWMHPEHFHMGSKGEKRCVFSLCVVSMDTLHALTTSLTISESVGWEVIITYANRKMQHVQQRTYSYALLVFQPTSQGGITSFRFKMGQWPQVKCKFCIWCF